MSKMVESIEKDLLIVKLINEYCPLEFTGEVWLGKCIFCEEGRICVDGKSEMFYCLDCPEIGDAISFLMAWRKCDLIAATDQIYQWYEIQPMDYHASSSKAFFLGQLARCIKDKNYKEV